MRHDRLDLNNPWNQSALLAHALVLDGTQDSEATGVEDPQVICPVRVPERLLHIAGACPYRSFDRGFPGRQWTLRGWVNAPELSQPGAGHDAYCTQYSGLLYSAS